MYIIYDILWLKRFNFRVSAMGWKYEVSTYSNIFLVLTISLSLVCQFSFFFVTRNLLKKILLKNIYCKTSLILLKFNLLKIINFQLYKIFILRYITIIFLNLYSKLEK